MSSAKPSPDLEDHLGYWLRRVSNQVTGGFARALHAREISIAEWVVLLYLDGNELPTPGDLARHFGLTKGAISKILNKTEAKGLISRAANPRDSRVQWLALTTRGKRIIPELAAIADKNESHFFSCLDPAEHSELKRLLQKLTDFHRLDNIPID